VARGLLFIADVLPIAILTAAVTTASATSPHGAEPAFADERRPRDAAAAEQPHLLSGRVELGLGGGLAGHASAEGEGWLGEWVGLGAHVAAFGAGELLGESRSASGGEGAGSGVRQTKR
jgi:hypothetical protein